VNVNSYASNYPQLMNQAIDKGYSEQDLRLLKTAFDFALRFSDGVYRAQGIPLIDHLTRTASIVMTCSQPIAVVITGLLHAVYVIHKFDHSVRSRNITPRKKYLDELLGKPISEMILQYEELDWYKESVLKGYITGIEQLDEKTKALIIVRLANELDDHLDMAMSYSSNARKAFRSNAYGSECVLLAQKLGLNDVSIQLANILERQEGEPVPDFLKTEAPQGYELTEKVWKKSVIESIKQSIKRLIKGKY